jgi:hypothetical protein
MMTSFFIALTILNIFLWVNLYEISEKYRYAYIVYIICGVSLFVSCLAITFGSTTSKTVVFYKSIEQPKQMLRLHRQADVELIDGTYTELPYELRDAVYISERKYYINIKGYNHLVSEKEYSRYGVGDTILIETSNLTEQIKIKKYE